jgi:hypothetical protein
MALPGITNANEFYAAHYLESVLAGDIKKVRERWSEEAKAQLEADPNADVKTPDAAFRALRKPWQKLREAEIGISAEPAERLRLQRELFFQPLMQALGYPYSPKAEPVLIGGEAYQIPLLAEVNNAKGEPWLWVVECFNLPGPGAHRWRWLGQRNLGGADLRANLRPGDPAALGAGGEPRPAAADRSPEMGGFTVAAL